MTATTSGGGAGFEERAVFVRKATGLVRGWSVRDAFIYATFAINLVTLGLAHLHVCAIHPERWPDVVGDRRRRLPDLPGDHICLADLGDATRRRRLRLDEPRARWRHRLRAGGRGLVVHPLVLGSDLRQHPQHRGVRPALGDRRLVGRGDLLGKPRGRVRCVRDHGAACVAVHRTRDPHLRTHPEVLLLRWRIRLGGDGNHPARHLACVVHPRLQHPGGQALRHDRQRICGDDQGRHQGLCANERRFASAACSC